MAFRGRAFRLLAFRGLAWRAPRVATVADRGVREGVPLAAEPAWVVVPEQAAQPGPGLEPGQVGAELASAAAPEREAALEVVVQAPGSLALAVQALAVQV